MCNNILELAGNPYTIEIATDLHPDPTYQLQQDWLSKVIIKISSLLNKIDIGVRLLIASVLFVAAIFIGYNIGGAGLVCKLISDVVMGVGIGVVSYGAITYLYTGKITSDGLAEAAVNAFLFASLLAFIYAGVNGIRYLFRTRPTVIDGVEIQLAQQSDFTPEAWDRIQSLQHRADGSTISSLRDGRFIHKGFKTEFLNNGKEAIIKGYGRVDCIIGNTLYELKPNNAWSIMRGIAQLHRYNVGMGGGYKLVLVLY